MLLLFAGGVMNLAWVAALGDHRFDREMGAARRWKTNFLVAGALAVAGIALARQRLGSADSQRFSRSFVIVVALLICSTSVLQWIRRMPFCSSARSSAGAKSSVFSTVSAQPP